ncbi:MAG: oxygen-independent coproporphyrinogen oxidase HemN, partial [Proteobacteria bacterium]|nr:oxygen-independent coproporphyrinogen oxidase HemN [Pseudomonadota bacterium]
MTSTTLELLQKYSVPGPRYTSYPTAPYFHTDFGEAEWVEALAAPAPDRELSLYAHIPFCDSLCHYCGCNMVATRDYSKTQPYLAMLDREMAHTAKRVDPKRVAHQLHWGGGTPTYL